jgi:DNA modification methylase
VLLLIALAAHAGNGGGRRFLGIELDQSYCDIAERRIAGARRAMQGTPAVAARPAAKRSQEH